MSPLALRRLGYAALGLMAPEVAGRRATDAFGTTRALGLYPDDVPPLGARRFAVEGDPDVTGGYLWDAAGGQDGDVPTALLVHGWGTDSTSMHGFVPPLRELGFRVAAFDAPGHGVCEGSQATMTQFTRAAGNVLDTLGGSRVVVAHSLGSIAAVSALATRPHLPVDCLVLVAPTCTLTGVLERWARHDLRLARPIVERVYEELWRRNGVPVSHWDVVARGEGLDVPVLVVHDPLDPMVPFDDAVAVAAGLRNARLEEAVGEGHIGILTAPAVKRLVADFVADHRDRADALAVGE